MGISGGSREGSLMFVVEMWQVLMLACLDDVLLSVGWTRLDLVTPDL